MNIEIRPLRERDLPEADRIFRLAFGTFVGLPDPLSFMAGADLVATRWRTPSNATLGAWVDDVLVGSNIAANWGSFGFFGPLTVRPDFWDKGVARSLLAATMDLFMQWGTRQAALFTFPHSPKHIGLYQKYGFWPQHLTLVMSKTVVGMSSPAPGASYAGLPAHAQAEALAACRAVTSALYPGLDVTSEIRAVADQQLGDSVLVHDGEKVVAFAICHLGEGSEAGPGAAYVKFAAVHPAGGALQFSKLLAACEALAAGRGMGTLTAGVNAACHDAYRSLLAQGFRTQFTGVLMQRENAPGFLRGDHLILADWR